MANKVSTAVSNFLGKFRGKTPPGTSSTSIPPTQNQIQQQEPFGSLPRRILHRDTGYSQTQNLSQTLDYDKVQNAFRLAERGDTTQILTFFRDIFGGNSAVVSELTKRKMAVLSEQYSIIPIDKNNQQDVFAAKVIEEMILHFPGWTDAIGTLMNAVLFPVWVAEKNFREYDESIDGPNILGLRFLLNRFESVTHELYTWRLPYIPVANGTTMPYALQQYPPFRNNFSVNANGGPQAIVYDKDAWEADLRFWPVMDNGVILRDISQLVQPDKARHFIFRCNPMSGISRENFTQGVGKAVFWWAVLSVMGRDSFSRMLDRYGVPFVAVHADTSQEDTVARLQNDLQLAQKLGGIVVDKEVVIELQEINMTNAAQAHEAWINLCHAQIAKLICGQELSSHAKSTGLGSGVANLQNEVRKDIIRFDRINLGTALRDQLFTQFLRYNGVPGRAPNISWGEASTEDAKTVSEIILNLANSGFSPAEADLEILSNKLGFQIQKNEMEPQEA